MNKFLLMLGLCRRAGAIIMGTPLVTASLPKGKTRLVIYAPDASANTKKKITDKCAFYGVKCIEATHSSLELSKAIGKESAICVLGITDDSFSHELIKQVEAR